jgi:TRAP-type mannitol/chloroaromatic compound transport system substrate-binding protein
MDDEAITTFAKKTKEYLDELKTKHPDVKKTLDSQEKFKEDFAQWREVRSGLTPWPLDDFIKGKRLQ